MVSKNQVYLVGQAFGLNSYTDAKPVKVNMFPSFTTSDAFNMEYLEDRVFSQEYRRTTGYDGANTFFERRVFSINGKKYS
ncbi:hypothetical protein, partial [Paenibacillus sp. PCH8]|uniref:hypothetical protein n=1 Tax=Paenibacillus sp. PCH8 TaxID=2066524 RepID=UPI001C613C9B